MGSFIVDKPNLTNHSTVTVAQVVDDKAVPTRS